MYLIDFLAAPLKITMLNYLTIKEEFQSLNISQNINKKFFLEYKEGRIYGSNCHKISEKNADELAYSLGNINEWMSVLGHN